MRILIIGDLGGQIGAASRIAKQRGAKVTQVKDIDAAMTNLRSGQGADLLMVEVTQDIARLTGLLTSERIMVPVIACGVNSDTALAVKAIKAGAKEYIPLPPDEELIAAVLEAIAEEHNAVIHASPAMIKVIALADQVAKSDASVLITGESGTGKEVIANYIHHKSRRAQHTFISVNCAAIPENLLESELFGHEKGAFTGAIARRIGKFEESNNGTLLLDEISEMDPRLQAKLLRVLQEQEIDRIGGSKPVKINIRVLATSNRNLQAEVGKGGFREDLYFRLNVIHILIPPLRERKADLPLLAAHFIQKYSKANGLPPRELSADAKEAISHYSWPGNVRELENIMHRAVLLSKGNQITASDIQLPITTATIPTPNQNARTKNELVGRTVESVERDLILDTVHHCLGNRTHAANILGISIRTLRNKLKQYGDSEVNSPINTAQG